MWSYEAVTDPNAVLDALSKENKEAEQVFRANRMDRIAREAEMQKAKERAERAAAYSTAVDSGQVEATEEDGQGEGLDGQAGASSTSTPAKASGSGAGSSGTSTPVFGAVSERKAGSSGGRKSGKKAARDVSAEVAHKITNATAMRSVGIFNKKQYSWLTSMPSVSSPLSGKGKKRKGGGSGAGAADEGSEAASPAGGGGVGGGVGSADGEGVQDGIKEEENGDTERANGDNGGDHARRGKKKQKLETSKTSDRPQSTGAGGTKRQKPRLTAPTRRLVVVSRDDKGVEKRLRDDHVLTVQDVLFALEREGVGKGMGSNEELIMRARILGDVEGIKRER